MKRREFLHDAARTVTATVTIAAATQSHATTNHSAETEPHDQAAQKATDTLPRRTLGRTNEKVTLLGIGMAPLGSDRTTTAQAEAVVHAALDLGIAYVDVSPDYGNAEVKLRGVLKTRRDKLFLVTKVNPDQPDKAGVQRQIENSLRRMGTDHIDAVHIHNLGDWNMETLLTPNGAVAGLKEAQKRGLIRYIGTSGHMRPPRFITAIESGNIDLTMNALNFADRNHYKFEELVLPVARKHGTGIVAMKVLGGAKGWQYDGRTPGTLAEHHAQAIRYSLGLPGVACAVIGLSSVAEVRQAVEVARNFTPLTQSEHTALLETGRKLAEARGLYYGPIDG